MLGLYEMIFSMQASVNFTLLLFCYFRNLGTKSYNGGHIFFLETVRISSKICNILIFFRNFSFLSFCISMT